MASLGIHALDPSALSHLPNGRVDIATLTGRLLAAGLPVRACRFYGP
jgi:hypothetical protein